MPDPFSLEDANKAFNEQAIAHLNASLDDPEHPQLFHYCSLPSAFNILRSGKIWASGIYHLNDASEVSYGASVVAELACRNEIDQAVREQFCNPANFMRKAMAWDLFAFCLSQRHDLLSQWRAYGKSGGGVCIGFEKTGLTEIRRPNIPNPLRIIYERRDQRQLLNHLVDIASEIQGGLAPDVDQRKYWLAVMSLIAVAAFRFKDEAFSEEQEWRLLWLDVGPTAVEFRPKETTLVPYIEAEFSRLAITKVVQGPLFNPSVGERSLRQFLEMEGYGHVSVEKSHIPLRSL